MLLTMLVVSTAIVVMQIAGSRVLSATVSYHAAFAVISLVMLGLATSAVSVYARRARGEVPLSHVTFALCAGAWVTVLAAWGFIYVPLLGTLAQSQTLSMLTALAMLFATFYAYGWAVAELLARFAADIGRMYWFDLTGAALGCVLATLLLAWMPALSALLSCGVLGAVGAAITAWHDRRRQRLAGLTLALATGALLVSLVRPDVLRVRYAKTVDQSAVLWERWNQLARVTVVGDIPFLAFTMALLEDRLGSEDAQRVAHGWRTGWGMSPAWEGTPPEIRWIELDTSAGTQIIEHGPARVGALDFLEWDITSAGHALKRGELDRVFVIGGGGGRDILTALQFGAADVDVAELNPAVVEAVEGRFRSFSGGVYSAERVHLTLGDGRNLLSRSPHQYDLIHSSMVDTWAASMAGALVLTENTLYTREAYEVYLSKLAPDGVFSVARWYDPSSPAESLRVVALMSDVLSRHGRDPAQHVAMLTTRGFHHTGVATILMKASPFDEGDRSRLRALAAEQQYEVIWPRLNPAAPLGEHPDLRPIMSLEPRALLTPLEDRRPPTDDRPFFFNIKRPWASWRHAMIEGDASLGSTAFSLFAGLTSALLVVAFALAAVPLWETNRLLPPAKRISFRSHWAPFVYFMGIGVAFMLAEIAIIQRYIVFLGHPTYALSVALFALLVAGGAGSALSRRFDWPHAVVLLGVAATAFLVPQVTALAMAWPLVARMVLAVSLIAPLGLVMGMLLPRGVRRLHTHGLEPLVPWMWAVNGLAGVFASVLGMYVATVLGYTAVLIGAGLVYGATWLVERRSWSVARL